ncbi:hypothetical protein KAU19_06290, partial [Candidatus Parcubacteria bacterium]|nr:hypothetical protein [Candidatus Parcubacteria bacterium]
MIRRKIFILIAVFCLNFCGMLFAGDCFAANASLYLAPSSGSYTIGNTFSIDVRVNTGEASVNAAQGSLVFSADKLEVISISKTGSIFNLWTAEPSFSNSSGAINFAGGAPSPGYNGTAGKIITVVFKAKLVGDVAINFSSGAVLANDGKGTNILTSMGGGKYSISPKTTKEETKPDPIIPKVDTKETKTKEDKEAAKFFNTEPPEITSLTHPDQGAWSSSNDVIFKWDLPYEANGVSVLLNESPTSNPGPVSDGLFSIKEYANVDGGVWYFHLKIKSGSVWSEISHFKIQIDTKPPEPFSVNVIQKEKADLPAIYFKTTDAVSGIDRHEIQISDQFFTVKPEKDTFQIPVLPPGKYPVIVKAIDKAGNETTAVADVGVQPIEAPVIKNYLRELKSSGQFFISGTALPDVHVSIFIQSENKDKIITRTVQVDSKGDWH